MKIEKIYREETIVELLNKMADKNNTIDLDAYAHGLYDMYDHIKKMLTDEQPEANITDPESLTITVKNPNSGHPLLDEIRKYGYNIPDEKTITVKPIIIDCETLDNTLSQHEEVEGYEFVNGVGGSVDCNNCEILDRLTMCPKSCVDFNGYYKRKE